MFPDFGPLKKAVKKVVAKKPPKPVKTGTRAATDVSPAGLAFIARWEGCVLHPYNDAVNNATIGVGHLIHRGPVTADDEARYKGFTEAQALNLLRLDAATAVHGVLGLGVKLTQNEFDALVSFAFNCGTGALLGGVRSNLLAGNKVGAMTVLKEYDRASGVELQGLVNRRESEANLFLNDKYE